MELPCTLTVKLVVASIAILFYVHVHIGRGGGGGCGVALGSFSSCTCSRWESVPHTHTNNTPLKPIQENLTNIPLDCRGDVEVLHVSEGSSVVESESRVLF